MLQKKTNHIRFLKEMKLPVSTFIFMHFNQADTIFKISSLCWWFLYIKLDTKWINEKNLFEFLQAWIAVRWVLWRFFAFFYGAQEKRIQKTHQPWDRYRKIIYLAKRYRKLKKNTHPGGIWRMKTSKYVGFWEDEV